MNDDSMDTMHEREFRDWGIHLKRGQGHFCLKVHRVSLPSSTHHPCLSFGGRVKKTVDDGSLITWTTYIGKLYVCEGTAPPLSCAKMIFSGSQRIAIKQVGSGSTSYFHPDHLGSTSVLTDGNGVSEQDISYYPYGDTRSNTGTADVPYKYTGKEQDNSTGLYFYEARYYDPVLGRFISADTIVPSVTDPQALNRYSYARNNPIIFNDPSGHFFKKAFKKIKKSFKGLNLKTFAFKYATWGVAFPVMDAILKTSPYVQMGVGVAVSAYAGPLGSAWYSAYTTHLNGGNIRDMTKAAAISYGSSVLSNSAGKLGGFVKTEYGSLAGSAVRAAGRGVVGGTATHLRGGRFELGFAVSAGASLSRSAYQGIVGGDVTLKPGGPAELKSEGIHYISGANNFGLANATEGALKNPCGLCEGSLFSKAANLVPGLQPTSGFHDVLTGKLLDDQGISFSITNAPTMPPAAVITYGAIVDKYSLDSFVTERVKR